METLCCVTQTTVQQNYEIWRIKICEVNPTHSQTWAVSHLCQRNSHYLNLVLSEIKLLEKWGDSSQENFTVPNTTRWNHLFKELEKLINDARQKKKNKQKNMAENNKLCHDLIIPSFHYVKQVMDDEQMCAVSLVLELLLKRACLKKLRKAYLWATFKTDQGNHSCQPLPPQPQ